MQRHAAAFLYPNSEPSTPIIKQRSTDRVIDDRRHPRHSGPMHQPTNPHPWNQPAPPRKKPTGANIALGVFIAAALCCGGAGIITTFTDDDPAPNRAAEFAAGATGPAEAGQTVSVPDGRNTSSPAATATRRASSSPTPAARKTSQPTTKPSSRRPKPRPATARPKPRPTTEAPTQVYYKNCTAVRAADADPIRRGDPGYGRHLDRDGDGVGCE